MYQFSRHQQTSLYTSSEKEEQLNFFGFYVLNPENLPGTISYEASWSDYTGLYIFLKNTPDEQGLNTLIQAIQKKFPLGSISYTSLVWANVVNSPEIYDFQSIINVKEHEKVLLNANFSLEILGASFLLTSSSLVIPNLASDGSFSGLIIEYPVTPENPEPVPDKNVHIPFSGALRGCIQAEVAFDESSENTSKFPQKGFYSFISKPDSPDIYQGCYYPLFTDARQSNDAKVYTGYAMRYDPLDPYNHTRSRFTYAGYAYQIVPIESSPYHQIQAVEGKELARLSGYSSVFGKQIMLFPLANTEHPASYVLSPLPPGYDFPYYLAPEGDFQVINDSENELLLACGLSGTEFFKIKPSSGDNGVTTILRFSANQPACVKDFPFILASPVGPPINPEASPFSDDYKTSWLTVLTSNAESTSYISQAKGSALYGLTGEMPSEKGFLGHVTNPFMFTSNEKDFFPLLPYAGLQKNDPPDVKLDEDIQTLESTVLSKQRHSTIISQTPDKATLLMNSGANDVQHTVLTPAGVIVKTTQNEQGSIVSWDQFLLAQKGSYELAFNQPTDQVISAMQSSNVFLVVSNNQHLANFSNKIEMGGWVLQADVGNDQTYGDYRNIMIFKGRKGKLYDTEVSNCLVANPQKWNQTEDFSIPYTKNNADPSQLIILSNWLQDYFKNAQDQKDANFTKFNTIASDENWTGILVLRARIEEMPEQMKGIVAGVKDPSSFYAHHFAIELSQTIIGPNGPEINGPSSIFGLINYNDPSYDAKKTEEPVAPDADAVYNFRLLNLKVLFENSTVKNFQSYAQVTLNELFGSTISAMGDGGNAYNSIILKGSFQENGGMPVYGLGTLKDYIFILNNNLLNKIEIVSARMNTISTTPENTKIMFAMTGYMDFKILQQIKENETLDIDLFSFGSSDGKTVRKGLHFSNLGLAMNYPTSTPEQKNFAFTNESISFNVDSSTIRENSLYSSFGLELTTLISGTNEDNTPAKQGFLNIITDLRLTGVDSGPWYGLKFRLNLGTPGELAGKAGLNADLLLAWSVTGGKDNDYQVNVGLSLPGIAGGASLISLQNVLKLSFGSIRLLYALEKETSQKRRFMLLLTDIALKFLGLMKIPPNGASMFYLFGNPEAGGEASGLGWYAMYKKDKDKTEEIFTEKKGDHNAI